MRWLILALFSVAITSESSVGDEVELAKVVNASLVFRED